MNTSVDAMALDADRPRTPRPAPHATHKLKLLLKREFWEHKGGFFWAPIWAGGISLLLTLMALVFGEVAARRAAASGKLQIDGDVMINGLDLGMITSKMDADDLRKLAGGIDLSMLTSSMWPLMVLGFVVFFYCLGSLYDERKDRSVLFWKSLPVSDGLTVWSKVVFALVVGPLIAVALALALMLATGIVASVFIAINGGNPLELYWSHLDPLRLIGMSLAWLPLYVLWSLPTVGWLLLCSAWAKSKPFLWALLLPLGAGLLLGWFEMMTKLDVSEWFWEQIVPRLLLGTWPGSHLFAAHANGYGIMVNEPDDLNDLMARVVSLDLLASASLWIGVVAGVAMIFAAIRLRRWRDEG